MKLRTLSAITFSNNFYILFFFFVSPNYTYDRPLSLVLHVIETVFNLLVFFSLCFCLDSLSHIFFNLLIFFSGMSNLFLSLPNEFLNSVIANLGARCSKFSLKHFSLLCLCFS